MQGVDRSRALPVIPTERHSRALARFQAFVAVTEGYAAHALAAVASEVVEDAARIEEGMSRHELTSSQGKQALATLLGVTLDRSARTPGITFCGAITKLRGIDALNRLWAAPDNLPSTDEVKDPFLWIERVLDD